MENKREPLRHLGAFPIGELRGLTERRPADIPGSRPAGVKLVLNVNGLVSPPVSIEAAILHGRRLGEHDDRPQKKTVSFERHDAHRHVHRELSAWPALDQSAAPRAHHVPVGQRRRGMNGEETRDCDKKGSHGTRK